MKIRLVDTNKSMVEAWKQVFTNEPSVEIVHGNITAQATSAWVTPTNAKGHMSGGVDLAIKNKLGAFVEAQIQSRINSEFAGRLPVGRSVIVWSGNDYGLPSFVIATATMESENDVISRTRNTAFACAAAFQALYSLQAAEAQKYWGSTFAQTPLVTSVAIPGLGSGTGQMPVMHCAKLMKIGYDLFRRKRYDSFEEMTHHLEWELGKTGILDTVGPSEFPDAPPPIASSPVDEAPDEETQYEAIFAKTVDLPVELSLAAQEEDKKTNDMLKSAVESLTVLAESMMTKVNFVNERGTTKTIYDVPNWKLESLLKEQAKLGWLRYDGIQDALLAGVAFSALLKEQSTKKDSYIPMAHSDIEWMPTLHRTWATLPEDMVWSTEPQPGVTKSANHPLLVAKGVNKPKHLPELDGPSLKKIEENFDSIQEDVEKEFLLAMCKGTEEQSNEESKPQVNSQAASEVVDWFTHEKEGLVPKNPSVIAAAPKSLPTYLEGLTIGTRLF